MTPSLLGKKKPPGNGGLFGVWRKALSTALPLQAYSARLRRMQCELVSTDEVFAWYGRAMQHLPGASLWQSCAWRRYKFALGLQVRLYIVRDAHQILASAQVVIDRTIGGLSTWDCPRGPLWKPGAEQALTLLLQRIRSDAKADRCMALFLSPPVQLPPECSLAGMQPSTRHEQPQYTRLVALEDDASILAQMKPKGRYNIRLAQRKGVRISESSDVNAYVGLMHATAERDGFLPPSPHALRTMLQHLSGCRMLLAHIPTEQSPIAGLILVQWQNFGIYYYGASDAEYRSYMAPYLLQWEAMQLCRTDGCTQYDLLGVAPPNADDSHPWNGITSFKEKFGGTLHGYPEESSVVLRPAVWQMLQWKRRLHR